MILAFMGYSLALGLLAGVSAWLFEKALVTLNRARRVAWTCGIVVTLLVPAAMVLFTPAQSEAVVTNRTDAPPTLQVAMSAPQYIVDNVREAEVAGLAIDVLAAVAWGMASSLLLGVYLFGAWRLARRARNWQAARIGTSPVAVAPDIGPAVFGWHRPRIVFPSWLISAPEEVQRLALAHEHEHVAARDPQLLSSATLLSALFPWNFPLLWMLRRLRFALEVDCDARVLRAGADANDYGLALLYVSERQARAPHGAIALIERTSQLERRIHIMFASPRKFPALIAGACLTLAGSCIFAAAQIDAPALATADSVLKLPPAQGLDSPGFRLGQRFELLLQEKYPELIRQEFSGSAIVVALVNEDWSIAASAKTVTDQPLDSIPMNEGMFGILGVPAESVPYVANMNMQLAKDSKKFVLMVYTEKKKPGVRFVSSLFPDTRATDRALFARHFPAALKQGVPAGQAPWVLLDRSGKVLRSGIEVVEPQTWLGAFQQRFKVLTREFTVTAVTDAQGEPLLDQGGKELQLNSVWLAPDSPAPRD